MCTSLQKFPKRILTLNKVLMQKLAYKMSCYVLCDTCLQKSKENFIGVESSFYETFSSEKNFEMTI